MGPAFVRFSEQLKVLSLCTKECGQSIGRARFLFVIEHSASPRLRHEDSSLRHFVSCEHLVESLEVELDAWTALDRIADVHDHNVKRFPRIVL